MSSSPALSATHCGNLLQILRRANAHYSHVASTIRVSIRPTHHARKRAAALRLTVSIEMALNLDPNQISTIPLPVLDRVITPPPPASFMDLSKSHGREWTHADRLVSKYTTPSYTPSPSPVYSSVPLDSSRSLVSCWSIDSDFDIAQELAEGVVITCDSDIDEGMILCSPTETNKSVRFRVIPTPQMGWASDISSPGSLSTGSTSTLARDPTPYDPDSAEKHIIRIKRKSAEIDDDVLGQRPKVQKREHSYNTIGWSCSLRVTGLDDWMTGKRALVVKKISG